MYILLPIKSTSEQNDISVSQTIRKVQFIISTKYNVQVERFGDRIRKIPDKTVVGLMRNFLAVFDVLIGNFFSDVVYISHL